MPRRKNRYVNKMTDRDIDRPTQHFGKEIKELGERISRKGDEIISEMEKRGDEFGRHEHRERGNFGFMGPLLACIFGIIVFAVGAWILGYVGAVTEISFLSGVSGFLLDNTGFFFLIFLFFGYISYLARAYPKEYRLFVPISIAAGVIVVLWIAAKIILIGNLHFGVAAISDMVLAIVGRLIVIFAFLVMLGYVIYLIIKHGEEEEKNTTEEVSHEKERATGVVVSRTKVARSSETEKHSSASDKISTRKNRVAHEVIIKRLCRSNKDKILGGVCGGIAEYFNIDPVIIRILWILGVFVWGFGIPLYIICWIIIPRNSGN